VRRKIGTMVMNLLCTVTIKPSLPTVDTEAGPFPLNTHPDGEKGWEKSFCPSCRQRQKHGEGKGGVSSIPINAIPDGKKRLKAGLEI
jgi:hypothetical protein